MKVFLSLILVLFCLSSKAQTFDKKIVNKDNLEATELKLADIDGDGDKDFVFIKNGYIIWGRNFGEKLSATDTISTNIMGMSRLECLDLDEDGDMDILASTETGKLTYWWKNEGSSEFSRHTLFNKVIKDFLFADLNKDGTKEIVIKYNGHITSYDLINDNLQEASELYEIDGTYLGTMKEFVLRPGSLPGVLVADAFEGILLLNQFEPGKYNKMALIPEAISQNRVYTFDADKDGMMDIFTWSYALRTLKYYHNNGDATFTEINTPLIGGEVDDLVQGDYDGDGDEDFMIERLISTDKSTLLVLSNQNQSFQRVIIDEEITDRKLVGISKVNKDEAPDLCVYADGSIEVYINTSSPLANSTISGPQVSLTPSVFINEFQITSAGRFDYKIFNVSGNCVSQGSAQDSYTPDASAWQSGMYFIQISSEGKMRTVKAMKA